MTGGGANLRTNPGQKPAIFLYDFSPKNVYCGVIQERVSMNCFLVADLHGSIDRYEKLFAVIESDSPDAVFIGGDILPHNLQSVIRRGGKDIDFLRDFLILELSRLRARLSKQYPQIFIIMGNDDVRCEERSIIDAEQSGIWTYAHKKSVRFDGYDILGYAHIPPSPFLLKDWERYDVSRFVDPGCVSPEEGVRTVEMPENRRKFDTIQQDLETSFGEINPEQTILLFHCPPYQTALDRAALDGRFVDYVPVDVNIGSIAIRRYIERRQPLLSLHGHVHESTRLTGSWRDTIGKTVMFNAAHDGPELSLIRIDPTNLDAATRELL